MDQSAKGERKGAKPYLIGFALALVLTAVPFAAVASHALSVTPTLIVIAAAAVLQITVHLRFFLHLDLSTTPRENLAAILFAGILILIMAGGTLWIMSSLNQRMAM
jgi:cytochrome o ubiquinol oxidase operon protein cyoD